MRGLGDRVVRRAALRWPLFGLTLLPLVAAGAAHAQIAGFGLAPNLDMPAIAQAPRLTPGLYAPALSGAPILPSGGVVRAGAVSIGATAGSTLNISQSSAKGIIDWGAFSIGSGGAVRFQNGSGATLNRVTGTGVSSLDGLLSASGSVYLINPNGVVVGRTGVVDVGGSFVASTLDVDSAAFLGGGPLTFAGPSTATVVNLGQVGALGGDVALIATTVRNEGAIIAPQGSAGLLAGSQVLMRDSALDGGRFAVLVGGPGTRATNTGTIEAATAELRANGGDVYALAGDTGGLIKATGVAAHDGRVFLVAEGGSLQVSGSIHAENADGRAGFIETSGDAVNLAGAGISTGQGGAWLIDPIDLAIDAPAASTISASLGGGTDVTVQTTASTASGPGVQTSGVGNITLNAGTTIAWASTARLTLSAYQNVFVNGFINVQNGGALSLLAAPGFAGAFVKLGSTGRVQYDGMSGGQPTGSLRISANGADVNYTLVADLATLSAKIAANNTGNYALAKPIDAGGTTYTGTPLTSTATTPFRGGFEGLGNAISNLTINAPAGAFVGLFGQLEAFLVQDIKLVGGSITAGDNVSVGALAGAWTGQQIRNVSSSVPVNGGKTSSIGGLLGKSASSTLSDLSSSAVVVGSDGSDVGGLIGFGTDASVARGSTSGAVTGGDTANVGGVFGRAVITYLNGAMSFASATGAVTGGAGAAVGGVVGRLVGANASSNFATNGTDVKDASATGDVTTGANGWGGGLVGFNDHGGISISYATGAVTGGASSSLGGLVGRNDADGAKASINSAYAMGPVIGGAGATVGGLIGLDTVNGGNIAIGGVYSTGLVAGGAGSTIGGLIGASALTGGTNSIVGLFWDTSTSGVTVDGGGGAGLATVDLIGSRVNGGTSGQAFSSTQSGLYPYLADFYPNGVQAISGIAYADAGHTPLASTASTTNFVSVMAGGSVVGRSRTGANGFYYVLLPIGLQATAAPVVAYTTVNGSSSGSVTGADLISAGYSRHTAAVLDAFGRSIMTQPTDALIDVDVWGGSLIAQTPETTLSGALARVPTASALLASDGGADQAQLVAASGGALSIPGAFATGYVATAAPGFTVDVATAPDLFVRTTTGSIAITGQGGGLATAGHALSLYTASRVATSVPVTIRSGTPVIVDSLAQVLDSLSFAGGGSFDFGPSNTGERLQIQGQAYTLLYRLALPGSTGPDAGTDDIAGINSLGGGGFYALATTLTGTGTAQAPQFSHVLAGASTYVQVNPGGFAGVFEGLGNTINNFTLFTTDSYAGLFGNSVNSQFRNLNMVGGYVTSTNSATGNATGAIAATGYYFVNDTSSVTISGAGDVGGLVGVSHSYIVNSSATGSVTGSTGIVGGLAGQSLFVYNSWASGSVSARFGNVGGLVGLNSGGVLDNDYATGQVSATVGSAGGLVGQNTVSAQGYGLISNSYATGSVNSGGKNGTQISGVGGLVGYNGAGSVTGSYANNSVQGGAGTAVGGLVGQSAYGGVATSHAGGVVQGQSADVGGLIGRLEGTSSGLASVADSYSTSAVSGGPGSVLGGLIGNDNGVSTSVSRVYASGAVQSGTGLTSGGLIGSYNGGSPIVSAYFDQGTTGLTNAVGSGTATGITAIGGSGGASPYAQATYAGFDFTPTGAWAIFDGRSRPLLRAEASTRIVNVHQLQLISAGLSGSYTIGADFDASELSSVSGVFSPGAGFTPIGTRANPFTGVLDGAGYTISNLTIPGGADFSGLFGVLGAAGGVKNLRLATVNIAGGGYTGALIGDNYGAVDNVTASGSVAGGSGVGGLIGVAEGGSSVTGSGSSVTVTASGNDVGGLIGASFGTVANSTVSGAVTGQDHTGGLIGFNNGAVSGAVASGRVNGAGYVGGLLGLNYAAVSGSRATGAVTGAQYVGGLVGWNTSYGAIDGASASGTVTGTGGYVGGLAGVNVGAITNSRALASATVDGGKVVGGLVGLNRGSVATSAAVNAVTGDQDVGGLVGWNDTGATISKSYATGAVTGRVGGEDPTTRDDYVGGLIGVNFGGASDVYATGAVSGVQVVGGLVGTNMPGGASITRAYATGAVTASRNAAGGFAGVQGGLLTNTYFQPSTSSQASGVGYAAAASAPTAIGPGTSYDANAQATYQGFDFTNTWQANSGSTPTLKGVTQ